jgi:pimeloyl-ACP methyl ester carboxylesterase
MKTLLASSLLLGLVGLAGCPDVKVDDNETLAGGFPQAEGPTVEFNPSAAIIPFPNNLVLDPATGKVSLPKQCNEGPAQTLIRGQVLNTLDGFGTYESALQVTFTEAFDTASLDGKVLLYQIQKGGTPNDPTKATAVPVTLIPGMAIRYDAACANPHPVPALNIVAKGVLDQRATYVVAISKGVKTTAGAEFGPSFFWAIVDQPTVPVEFDASGNVTTNHTPLDPKDAAQKTQLQGISLLWNVHKGPLDFLAATGHARSDILLAWSFNTQSNDALDPAAVANAKISASPASALPTTPLLQTHSLTTGLNRDTGPFSQCPQGDSDVQCFLKISIGKGDYTAGNAACASLGCAAIGDVLGAGLSTNVYQQDTPNPLGLAGAPIPGPWSDPSRPMLVKTSVLSVLIMVPATVPAANGTVVFGHGLGSNKESAFAIAGNLAANGFTTVAIDFVAHGSRAVKVTNSEALKCGAAATPGDTPQCYAPFLSTDLAGTRDNIRQTVLDLQGLLAAVKACGTTACGPLQVDPAHIHYMGISLGGIIGSTVVANSPNVKASVLNVPGVGLIDILENTPSNQIRCTLVDGLIDAGVVMGTKSNPPDYTTGTCTTDAWKTQPAYQQFAVIGRWILDPADGANFTPKLAAKKILIQEVVNDEVVPNIATDREGALVGLMPLTADPLIPPLPKPASAAITTNPTANKWVRYPAVPAAGQFPGNSFHHASLLQPDGTTKAVPTGTPQGQLGTARMQTDAITFLVLNH